MLRTFCWSKSPYFCCTALSPFLGLVKYSHRHIHTHIITYIITYIIITYNYIYICIHVHTYNTYIYKLNMTSHLLSSTPPSKDCEIVTWVHCLGGEHKWWMFKSTMVIHGYLWLSMAGLIEYGWTVELFFDDAGWFWRTWDHVDYIYINYHILLWFSAWSPIVWWAWRRVQVYRTRAQKQSIKGSPKDSWGTCSLHIPAISLPSGKQT